MKHLKFLTPIIFFFTFNMSFGQGGIEIHNPSLYNVDITITCVTGWSITIPISAGGNGLYAVPDAIGSIEINESPTPSVVCRIFHTCPSALGYVAGSGQNHLEPGTCFSFALDVPPPGTAPEEYYLDIF